MIDSLAARFLALFAGYTEAYGTYNNIDKQRDNGKRVGDAFTVRRPVTVDLWKQHLSGENGIGIIPVRDDATAVFGAIDVDVYDQDAARVAALLVRLKLPLIPCRSKSGGVHAYLFCKDPVPASKMQEKLREVAALMGYGTSEIFPKQARIHNADSGDLGSWINMPYFSGDITTRYALLPNGDPITAEEFLAFAERNKVDPEFFDEKQQQVKKERANALLPDGPPCLQHLLELGGFPEGTRDGGLFALGIYFRKARPTDWCEHVEAANNKYCNPPLAAIDVQKIVSSLAKKEYVYPCSKHPIAPHCNAVACRTRKYGVGGGASSFPVLCGLRKLLTIPPVWFLDVLHTEGDLVTLELSTDDLQDPVAFQRKCMDRLDMMPAMPSKVIWQQTVQQLLSTCTKLTAPDDSSVEGQFWELFEGFCTGRAQARGQEEILLGKPWTENGRTYFRLQDLMAYLQRKQFKDYKIQQLSKVLQMKKHPDDKKLPLDKQRFYCHHEFVHINKKGVNLWDVPEFAKAADPFDVPDNVKDSRF